MYYHSGAQHRDIRNSDFMLCHYNHTLVCSSECRYYKLFDNRGCRNSKKLKYPWNRNKLISSKNIDEIIYYGAVN